MGKSQSICNPLLHASNVNLVFKKYLWKVLIAEVDRLLWVTQLCNNYSSMTAVCTRRQAHANITLCVPKIVTACSHTEAYMNVIDPSIMYCLFLQSFLFCHYNYIGAARFFKAAHDRQMTEGEYAWFIFTDFPVQASLQPWTIINALKLPENYLPLDIFYSVNMVSSQSNPCAMTHFKHIVDIDRTWCFLWNDLSTGNFV